MSELIQHMQPHQQRVVQEKKELDEKINSLHAFINGDPNQLYSKLPEPERMRMNAQLQAMCVYTNILGQRIGLFALEALRKQGHTDS